MFLLAASPPGHSSSLGLTRCLDLTAELILFQKGQTNAPPPFEIFFCFGEEWPDRKPREKKLITVQVCLSVLLPWLESWGYRAGALTQVEVRAFWEVRTWLSRDNQGPALEEAVYRFHAQWDLAALSLVFCLFFLPQVVPVAARLLLEMFSGELSWSADSIRLQISNPDLKDHMVEQFKELHHIWQSQQRLQGQVLQPGPVAQAPPVAGLGADQGPWPMHPVSMQ